MRTKLAYVIASIVMSMLAPWAIEGKMQPYPIWIAIGAFVVVTGFALVVAVPINEWLRARNLSQWFHYCAAGFISAFISFSIFGLLIMPTNSSVDGVLMVIDGQHTQAGWLTFLRQCLHLGLAGAISGLVFWRVCRKMT